MKQNKKTILLLVLLIASIIAVYWPVYKYDFVKYDDDVYVTDNKNIQKGFALDKIKWAFTSGYASNWHPITWLSHTLDYQLFKDWAGGHHLINILFHIANTILLFYFFKKTTSALWPSFFVAAAFAVHPLHVESAAWIAERKDVLSTFFWILTIIAYVIYTDTIKINKNTKIVIARSHSDEAISNLKWYVFSLTFFILGLMTKPMLVTLPFVLLLIDYWPLERKISRRLFFEKIPFFVFSAVSCVITYIVQHQSGAITKIEAYGLKLRIANIVVSYGEYIWKMIWPMNLACLYPFPAEGLPASKIIFSGIALLLISVFIFIFARKYKFAVFGWLWYLGTLVPVIGFVQVGAHAIADRYTYIPLTGLFIIIAFGFKELIARRRYKVLLVPAAGILIFWFSVSLQQVKYWKDSLTLFAHTLDVTKTNFIILANYAACLNDAGKYDEAIEYSKKLIEVKPESPEIRNDYGCGLMNAGRYKEAIEQFQLALKYKPQFPQAFYNLGNSLKKTNDYEQAADCYRQAINLKTDYTDAYVNLAFTLFELQKYQESLEICDKVLGFEPGNVFAHGYRAMSLAGQGKLAEAIEEIRYVLKFRPNDVEMHRNLGILLERNGQNAEAVKAYKEALRIDPDDKNSKLLLEAVMKK
ncbi:MAG: TPR repeat-containing protein YrrB [Planctomycetes bacterium ADurb.Bin401]|nr:MAG: TPR repeat-containing protein YrrB [Planctomycetes bacterium ADurb.Bin401]